MQAQLHKFYTLLVTTWGYLIPNNGLYNSVDTVQAYHGLTHMSGLLFNILVIQDTRKNNPCSLIVRNITYDKRDKKKQRKMQSTAQIVKGLE